MQNAMKYQWCCGVVTVTTAERHLSKPELRFCTGSKPVCGMFEIDNSEDL